MKSRTRLHFSECLTNLRLHHTWKLHQEQQLLPTHLTTLKLQETLANMATGYVSQFQYTSRCPLPELYANSSSLIQLEHHHRRYRSSTSLPGRMVLCAQRRNTNVCRPSSHTFEIKLINPQNLAKLVDPLVRELLHHVGYASFHTIIMSGGTSC